MPNRIVIMKPPGSLPGIISFAITPTTNPITIVHRKCIHRSSFMKMGYRSCLCHANQRNPVEAVTLQPPPRGHWFDSNSILASSQMHHRVITLDALTLPSYAVPNVGTLLVILANSYRSTAARIGNSLCGLFRIYSPHNLNVLQPPSSTEQGPFDKESA